MNEVLAKQIDLTIHWIPIEHIKPNEWNINSLVGEKYDALKNNILKRGFIEPIVVRTLTDNKFQIINGFHRYSISKEIGLKQMPCIIYNCDDIEAQAITIGANEFRGETNLVKFSDWIDDNKNNISKVADNLCISEKSITRYMGYNFPSSIIFGDKRFTPLSLLLRTDFLNSVLDKIKRNSSAYYSLSPLQFKEYLGYLFYQAIYENEVKYDIPMLYMKQYEKAQIEGAKKNDTIAATYYLCQFCGGGRFGKLYNHPCYKNSLISIFGTLTEKGKKELKIKKNTRKRKEMSDKQMKSKHALCLNPKCGYKWIPRKKHPLQCPMCHRYIFRFTIKP